MILKIQWWSATSTLNKNVQYLNEIHRQPLKNPEGDGTLQEKMHHPLSLFRRPAGFLYERDENAPWTIQDAAGP